jgi:hypothetical protein
MLDILAFGQARAMIRDARKARIDIPHMTPDPIQND